MRVRDVIEKIPWVEAQVNDENQEIKGITFDSRKVCPGDVFFALCGANTDGHLYLAEALQKGAILLIGERREPLASLGNRCSWLLVESGRKTLAFLSCLFYGDPSASMRVTGVTGTNGKTTTCFFIHNILEKNGFPCGLLTTVRNLVGPWEFESINTTEESLRIFVYLDAMRRMGISHVVMEVSSHGLAIGRVEGVHFDAGVVTNIVPEHLEFHRTFEHYFQSKRKLLEKIEENLLKQYPRVVVVNGDDDNCLRMVEGLGIPFLTFGLESKRDVWATQIELSLRRSRFQVFTPWGTMDVVIPYPGVHNVYNALGAISVALFQGISVDAIREGLASCRRVPGRWELVEAGQEFVVIVDFAHNWHGLEYALSTVRTFTTGRVIAVFGCGGERDRNKRPMMGEIVARYSDWCIITADNPRGEDPLQTAQDALRGVEKIAQQRALHYEIILDRVEAIKKALSLAQKGDTVFLAGKGPERFQVYDGKIIPHSDYCVAKRLLEKGNV